MRFLVVGWFSATADSHYSVKPPCGKQILLVLVLILEKPGLLENDDANEWEDCQYSLCPPHW